MSWIIGNDGYPTNTEFIPLPEKAMQRPYPDALWRIDSDANDGYPYNKLMLNHICLGAFANATNLKKVHIPRSCKKIGREAFRNTKLTSVTIASDCTYYDTSFPEGCVVNFYPD